MLRTETLRGEQKNKNWRIERSARRRVGGRFLTDISLVVDVVAQIAKVFTYYMVVRKWDFRMVMGSGGMPSSHSALCFALTTSVAFVHGVSDGLFPVCLGFTLIVMYDAAGVRRHAGRQAEVSPLLSLHFASLVMVYHEPKN